MAVKAGTDLDMVKLQSLVSQRQSVMQLVTGMMSKLDDTLQLEAPDEVAEMQIQTQLLAAGVLTVNEVRSMRGLAPFPSAEEFISANGRETHSNAEVTGDGIRTKSMERK